MPKSRGRKPKARARRSPTVSPGFLMRLGGGLFAVPPEISAGRLAELLARGNPRDPLLLTEMVDHPVASDSAAGYLRRGMNIASEIVVLLAESFSPDQAQHIANPARFALTETIRDHPARQIQNGDWRFERPGPDGTPTPIRIDRLPLPDGTPSIARIDPQL